MIKHGSMSVFRLDDTLIIVFVLFCLFVYLVEKRSSHGCTFDHLESFGTKIMLSHLL